VNISNEVNQALRAKRGLAVDLMIRDNLDAIAFVPGANFLYLTNVNLHLMERLTLFVLTREGDQFAVIPSLEKYKWSHGMPSSNTIYWKDTEGPFDALKQLWVAVGVNKVLGIEGMRMRAAEFHALSHLWGNENVVDADTTLSSLRIFKDADELADLSRAIEISERALNEVYDGGIGARSELEISGRLKAAMLAHGASGFAFEPIVLAGQGAANPHGDSGNRVVMPGDALLVDFGASYGTMHADITRTVFCEHCDENDAALYEVVLRANEAGRSAVGPKNTVGQVDLEATEVLASSQFKDLILHKTGHGLGREVHEAPQVMLTNTQKQEPGMVFTVEPGLYLKGKLGVRIEDNVVVTDQGHACLTQQSREILTYA